MRLTGRRESSNVEDRRGRSGGGVGKSLGIGGIIVVGLITLLMGGDLGDVFNNVSQMGFQETTESTYTPTAEDEELAKFTRQILAGTEDVWTQEFKKMGKTYRAPRLVMFTDAVQSGCGGATSSTGPFYCSADQTVYIDLSFFKNMKRSLGADGDFAYAYVIAHEVGHHVQYLLGILGEAHSQMQQMSQKEANRMSVRLELQADFLAGIWAHQDNEMFGSLEDGDIEEGINAASKIGDDYLQKKAQGYTVPDSFNHGTSAQRMRWLKKGITTGDVQQGDTFSQSYDSL
ncbi:MAG: neutral zinc metallopeptidase [Muribaculaceae bacterium]|nr:neutral zinc metallopeptidase [Muribaculaceae bacterium]